MENIDLSVLKGKRVGLAVTGSFCTFEEVFKVARRLREEGASIVPIMSFNASTIDTKFGTAEANKGELAEIAGKEVITTIAGAEPIGPKGLTDIMLVAPCTGNTLAKLALSITDTPVIMAVKSHLRGGKPVVIALATNDALSGSAKHIGALLNTKNYYFVQSSQDNPKGKPRSMVAKFDKIPLTLVKALSGEQESEIVS